MNYYERHLGDYAKDTGHLSILEHGVYTLLLDRYYSTEEGIPAAQAYRLARARSPEECQAVDAVLDEFFVMVDGVWINRRADEEIAAARVRITAAQENGKKGGRPPKKPSGIDSETQEKPSGFSLGSENETQQKAHHLPSTNIFNSDELNNAGAKRPRFDASDHLQSLGVDAQLAADWLAVRKAKKAATTRTAIDGVASEAAKAGMPLPEVLRVCCRQGWAGFKASWDTGQGAPPGRPTIHDQRAATIAALTGRDRRHEQKSAERDITADCVRVA